MLTAQRVKACLDYAAFYRGELGDLRPGNNGNALALCPFHADTEPSLSVNLDSGLWQCFGCGASGDIIHFYMRRHNCDFTTALWELARFAGLDSDEAARPGKEAPGLTLEQFAAAKKLPAEFLAQHGVREARGKDGRPYLVFKYKGLGGQVFEEATRMRFFLEEKPKAKRGGKPHLYGLWRIPAMLAEDGELLILEGESDCLTAWYHCLSAIALPGKTMTDLLDPATLDGFKTIYVWQEPGAEDFPVNVARALPNFTVKRMIPPEGIKDLSEAHIRGLDVLALVRQMQQEAKDVILEFQNWTKSGPQDTSGAPTWPREAIGGAAGRFAALYSAYLETPHQFLAMGYLTFWGHLLFGKIALASELKPPPLLYTVFLGESGNTRKTTSIAKVDDFFRATVDPADLNVVYGVGSAEGLAKCFKINSRVLLAIDELKTIVNKMKIDTSVLLPCINTLFEITRFHSKTKQHEIKLDKAELCMLAASTLETYRNMFNPTFMDIGFVNRLFIVIGETERKFAIPQIIPDIEKDQLKDDLRSILKLVDDLSANGCFYMPLTPEALDIFEKWYFKQPDSVFSTRLDTYGHRLMLLLAINEGLRVVTLEIAEKTVKLLKYQYDARVFADPIDADSTIARLEERIRRLLTQGSLSKRELERRGNKSRYGIWAWEQAIKNLKTAGEISWDHKRKEFQLKK